MALFIVGSYKASPYDPDSAFDPVTHVATESSFIQLLEHGVYDSKYIGYKVQLGNSVDYNNGLWVIADVNHDSANTGQTDCYDLISENVFGERTYSDGSTWWQNSTIRTYLSSTFYDGFGTDIKTHILSMKYKAGGSWLNDKIIIPSCIEVNITSGISTVEGTQYPIFTDNNSRIKNIFNSTAINNEWWTRTQNYESDYGNYMQKIVYRDGSPQSRYYNTTSRLAPLMRVH